MNVAQISGVPNRPVLKPLGSSNHRRSSASMAWHEGRGVERETVARFAEAVGSRDDFDGPLGIAIAMTRLIPAGTGGVRS